MVKIAGSVCLISGGAALGFILADRFVRRCRVLKTCIFLMEIFKVEIFYQARFLPEVFRNAAGQIWESGLGKPLNRLAEMVEFGSASNLADAWSYFLQAPEFSALGDQDKQVLNELGSNLGMTDRQDQLAKINLCQEKLKILLERAEDERRKQTGLYRYLGFAAGTILVLWLV